jgi:hypothetical protein
MYFVFEHLLNNPPVVPFDLAPLIHYLKHQWLPKCDTLCAWDGEIPRTTNVSEGYHNGMRYSFEK